MPEGCTARHAPEMTKVARLALTRVESGRDRALGLLIGQAARLGGVQQRVFGNSRSIAPMLARVVVGWTILNTEKIGNNLGHLGRAGEAAPACAAPAGALSLVVPALVHSGSS